MPRSWARNITRRMPWSTQIMATKIQNYHILQDFYRIITSRQVFHSVQKSIDIRIGRFVGFHDQREHVLDASFWQVGDGALGYWVAFPGEAIVSE